MKLLLTVLLLLCSICSNAFADSKVGDFPCISITKFDVLQDRSLGRSRTSISALATDIAIYFMTIDGKCDVVDEEMIKLVSENPNFYCKEIANFDPKRDLKIDYKIFGQINSLNVVDNGDNNTFSTIVKTNVSVQMINSATREVIAKAQANGSSKSNCGDDDYKSIMLIGNQLIEKNSVTQALEIALRDSLAKISEEVFGSKSVLSNKKIVKK